MSPTALEQFQEHVEQEFPKEACGLLVATSMGEQYFPCRNAADDPHQTFQLDPRDYLRASCAGAILAICHSHPNGSTKPSGADLTACGASNLPWYIARWPGWEVRRIEPAPYTPPLRGRPFVHGVHDCYAVIRDYYRIELDIELPDFERTDGWWDNGQDLYRENFGHAGFSVVPELKKHDVILMQFLAPVPHHAAVYLGDDVILHHLSGRLSDRVVYGGYWARHTTCFLRHKDLP